MNKVILYEGWQLACCGVDFAVGDHIQWTVLNDNMVNLVGVDESIDYVEDHHTESNDLRTVSGEVGSIDLLYNKYITRGRTLTPVASKTKPARDTKNINHEYGDYEFSGFIIHLTNSKIDG